MVESPVNAASGSQGRVKDRRWMAYASLAAAFLVVFVFPCACGHLGREALPLTGAAAALGLYAWLTTRAALPGRLLCIAAFILAALLLFKNIADVLWFGHDAVW